MVGNVLTAPEWRRTNQSGTLVANFKVASTARRLDRDSGRWVDGNSLRVRVNCWRRLAEGVAASVAVGDPVIVAGRLYTRDWTDEAGNHRTIYELEAIAVGHDLSRGRSRFLRNQPRATTSTVEDAEAEQRVHGEITEAVPDEEAPATLDDRPFDDDFPPPEFEPARVGLAGSLGRTVELDPFDDRPGDGGVQLGGTGADEGDELGGEEGDELGGEEGDELGGTEDDELAEVKPPVVEGRAGAGSTGADPGDERPVGGRAASGRRGRRRTPVPA
ncbi:single-stranded DNA-binding protein [Micromonospora sp. WMMD998]|uniref:single-stranded DNA-binding protein n=1 Tax=Micromonospora sp. WMMD998 TaxID=3016092 RepID=UPI00249BC5C5|nr:single-stranded DNA-binding protein [Micromonospora sp. WMMD998]WFE42768.1 single-stranded DNA-binding protein [Micromonospora sp. WMMD998]